MLGDQHQTRQMEGHVSPDEGDTVPGGRGGKGGMGGRWEGVEGGWRGEGREEGGEEGEGEKWKREIIE